MRSRLTQRRHSVAANAIEYEYEYPYAKYEYEETRVTRRPQDFLLWTKRRPPFPWIRLFDRLGDPALLTSLGIHDESDPRT